MTLLELTTVDRVKLQGEIKAEDTQDDAFIASLIPVVSAEFEKFVGRGFMLEQREEEFDVEAGQREFWLPAFPVTGIVSVHNSIDQDWAGTPINATDYTVQLSKGRLLLLLQPWAGTRALRVVWTGGLAADTTTLIAGYPDLAQACDMQVLHAKQRRSDLGSTGRNVGAESMQWDGAYKLLPAVVDRLRRYQRLNFE